jgi:predicted nucleic-acid-binding protein
VIAVDTNVLVRALVEDPKEKRQVKVARARISRAGAVWISQIVQVETVWVLETAYRLDKPTVVAVLDHLLGNRAYVLQREETFRRAYRAFKEGSADFADYLILAESEAAGHALVTFDRRLQRTAGVTAA